MRVLHVTTGKTWRGGEQQLLYLTRGLARQHLSQQVVCVRDSPIHRRLADESLPTVPMAIRNEIDVFALRRIVDHARRFRPDVMHLHTSQAHGLGAVAARCLGRRRPAVVVTRRVDYSIFRHTFLGMDRIKYHPGADQVLCVSDKIRSVLESDGLPSSMLHVARSGIDLARFDQGPVDRAAVRASLGVPDDALLIGNVAHLADHKGQRYLIEAFPAVRKALDDVWGVIVGDGKLRADLRARAVAADVSDRLLLAGFRSDVPQVLHALDVFAFPSHMEGLGTSVLDALACRLPVVATVAGGIPEIIEHERHGLLVPPKDPDALAAALIRALRHPDEAKTWAAAGRARVEASFTYERTAQETRRAYARALSGLR